MGDGVLEVDSLTVDNGGPAALQGVSLSLSGGEAFALVGESGVGKSLLCAAITGTLRPPFESTAGEVRILGRDLLTMGPSESQKMRGSTVGYIGPNPHSLLHPMITVGRQVANVLRAHEAIGKREARGQVTEMFDRVGIPDPERRFDVFPHELSGGMAQRVVIAMGLICEPSVVIADEPTFGLDVTIQAQVLELMNVLIRGNPHRTILISTRDLGVVANFCDRVSVLADGSIVEVQATRDYFSRPASEAGRVLLESATGQPLKRVGA